MVPTQRFRHPELGVVHIVSRMNARRFVARWKGDELSLTVPAGCSVAEVEEAIEAMKPRLLANRPKSEGFYYGWTYATPETKFTIAVGDKPNRIYPRVSPGEHRLMVPDPPGPADPRSVRMINGYFDYYAKVEAEGLLIPQAAEVAERLGVKPRRWVIGRGENRRGSCSARGEISLSRNLVFFPVELREYVICHELAHLTHFDHSRAFHELLDSYLGGREAELKARSNAHRLPFIR